MRIFAIAALGCAVTLGTWACGTAPASSPIGGGVPGAGAAADGGVVTGFEFVDSSVTGQGSKAKLPAGAKIYPSGSKLTGAEGCPTTRYQTDGLMVAVIDYNGRPTSASLAVTRHPATGGTFNDAPYYLDLNPGRTLQFMGPLFENGTYDIQFEYDYAQGAAKKASATITLARNCPQPR
jgi:hypothetical protein